MSNTAHLNYEYWSVNYRLGVDSSILLLDDGHSQLLEFQTNFLKIIQKKIILGSHNSGLEILTKSRNTKFEGNLLQVFEAFVGTIQDSNDSKLLLSTVIESDVIIPLTNFISSYKNFIEYLKDTLHGSLEGYNSKVRELKKSKLLAVNLIEALNNLKYSTSPVSHKRNLSSNVIDSLTSKFNQANLSLPTIKTKSDKGMNLLNLKEEDDETPLQFPLELGDSVLTFENVAQLANFIQTMFNNIPKSVTKIIFTSYKLESIAAKDISDWLTKSIIPGRSENLGAVNNNLAMMKSRVLSRSQVERIGQSLIDNKLITASNIAKKFAKFRSDDDSLWFEYTDLFKYIMSYEDKQTEQSINSYESDPEEFEEIEQDAEQPSKTTSRELSNPLLTFSTYLSGNDKVVDLELLQSNKEVYVDKFEKIYEEYLDLRLDLEKKLHRVNNDIEQKEHQRISIVYDLMEKLTEILSKQFLSELQAMEQLKDSINVKNTDVNHRDDTSATIKLHSAHSIYSINSVLNSSNAAIQILSDRNIPLFGSHVDSQVITPDTASQPYFISEVLKSVPQELWNEPFDYAMADTYKKLYIGISRESSSQMESIDKFLAIMKPEEPIHLLNVFKLYLLELPDSIIPSFVYQEIKHLVELEDKARHSLLLKVLENKISRVGLSALISLLNHIHEMDKDTRSLLNNNSTPGSIPFIHLCFRQAFPDDGKDAFVGYNIEFFNQLLADLLAVREELPDILTRREKQTQERKEMLKHKRQVSQLTGLNLAKSQELNGGFIESLSRSRLSSSSHARNSSYDSRNSRNLEDTLKPFGLKERARSKSRSPSRRKF